jgi:hypothetical protein
MSPRRHRERRHQALHHHRVPQAATAPALLRAATPAAHLLPVVHNIRAAARRAARHRAGLRVERTDRMAGLTAARTVAHRVDRRALLQAALPAVGRPAVRQTVLLLQVDLRRVRPPVHHRVGNHRAIVAATRIPITAGAGAIIRTEGAAGGTTVGVVVNARSVGAVWDLADPAARVGVFSRAGRAARAAMDRQVVGAVAVDIRG